MKNNNNSIGAKILAGAAIVVGTVALLAVKAIASVGESTDKDSEDIEIETDWNEPNKTYGEAYQRNEKSYHEFLRNGRKGYRGPVPGVCKACGGDYPHCTWGCPQFDDD